MPENILNLKTEFDYYTNVLVIDELGEISIRLVDALLDHGCLVYYFGKEKKETFYYLLEKNNFVFLNSISEIEKINKLSYLFHFPAENEILLSCADEINWLTEKYLCKTLICCSIENPGLEKYFNLVKEGDKNRRLVVFENIFGPRIEEGLLAKFFKAGIWENKGAITENKEKKVFPLFVDNLVKEMVKTIFIPETKSKAYFLKGEEISFQKFGELAANYYSSFHPNFLGKEIKIEKKKFPFEEICLTDDLNEEVEKTVNWFRKNIPQTKESLSEETRSKAPVFEKEIKPLVIKDKDKENLNLFFKEEKRAAPQTRKILFGILLFLGLVFFSFVVPLALAGIFGTAGIRDVQKSQEAIDRSNFSLAIKKNESGGRNLNFARKVVLTTSPFYGLLGLDKETEAINETLLFAQNLNVTYKFALLASRDWSAWINDFINGGGGKEEALGAIKANLGFAYERASLTQTSLTKVEPVFRFIHRDDLFEKIKKYLLESREILLKGQNLLGVMPEILGFKGRKTYLVLFENNAELRPTGGFIGSFAVVSLEKGQLLDFEVSDVYQADGQLKGHVEPPAKLKEYLGEASWYLRDSNWDPDFSVSAQRAQWFLDKEMQVSVDGTVAVTLEAAAKVMGALGEVAVPEYQEKINKDNLFQKAEYYAELATFPGSTQKKDFLGSLAQALFEKIKNTKGKELISVGGAVFAGLEQKEVLAYFDSPEIENVFSGLNWAGKIREYQPVMTNQPIFADFLLINEANVGINKANYFVERKISQEISLLPDGGVSEKLTVAYDNKSPAETWPAGRYKNYLRLYLPKGARVTAVSLSDPKNSDLWLPYDFKNFGNTEDHEKSLFSFLLDVPIKSQQSIEIKYELPQKVDLSKKLSSYLLLLQKQPGAYPSDYTLSFVYPAGFVPLRVIPSAVIGEGKLLIQGKLDRDLIFQIDLAH